MIRLRIETPLKGVIRINTKDHIDVTTNTDYDRLKNKPQINRVVLQGNKDFEDLGMSRISNIEIFEIMKEKTNEIS